MVTVKVTETYDMKTSVGKMGILGVHTPDVTLVRRLYPGLLKSHKYIRFLKCDVVGACASVLPADPLQVGVSAGDVAPEDMFNPILYKAVTNESFDTLVSRVMRTSQDVIPGSSFSAQDTTMDSDFKLYYALLAENGEFRKAMPQSGFKIANLVPICHTLISNYGQLAPIENLPIDVEGGSGYESVPDTTSVNLANGAWSADEQDYKPAVTFRGRPVRMPRIPIHYGVEAWDAIPNPDLVKTMVAVLVVPPARLHEFYYRVRITWYIRFEEICSTLVSGDGTAYSNVGTSARGKNFSYAKSAEQLDNPNSSVDSNNVNIEKIMES